VNVPRSIFGHPLAHGGVSHGGGLDGGPPDRGPDPHAILDALRAWGLDDPLVLLGLALTAVLYAVGVRRIRRGAGGGAGLPNWQIACYWTGWATLAVALASPIHPLGGVLFWVHMTQHELLMLVAAPLLVLGRPMAPTLTALPKPWARRLAHAANAPAWRRAWAVAVNALVAWLFHGVVLWAWHVPALFQATLTSDVVHALQHLSFLGSALLF
jgi:putative membrane protein